MESTFGERLKQLRKEAGLTQSQFSEKLNVHLQTVSKWERGVNEPDFSLLGEISQVLGVTVERLIGAEESEQTYTGRFDAALFGKALGAARRCKGDSQEGAAERFGVSPCTISKWERGVVCPDMSQLAAIAQYCGMPASRLYYGIIEEARTETPRQARRRNRLTYLLAAAAVLLLAALACTFALLPLAAGKVRVYTVEIDGARYEVGENDWFTPQAAQRDGYDFIGFADEEGELVDFPCKIGGDTQFTAVFEPHKYAIDYWLNGGSIPSSAVTSFTVESGSVQLPVPQKPGAVFEGWYLTADYSGSRVESVACGGQDLNVYAKWSDAVYSVRYELGGGSLAEENPTEVTADAEQALNEPLRAGYNFLGWYDAPQGGERYETVGGAGAKNLTLYALWQESGALYTVMYDPCGGEQTGENPVSVGAGEHHVLNGAQKTGYDFVGWNDRADGSGTFYAELYGIREDLRLYAIYAPKTYTLVYELDEGTYYSGSNPNKIEYGETVELMPVAKAGHTFLGWYDAEAGGERVTQVDVSNILRLHTLYARFEPKRYTVLLDGAGGLFEAEVSGEGALSEEGQVYGCELTLLYGESVVLPACTLAGYDFLGWYDERGERVEEIGVENIGDMVLTARYRESGLTYTVFYELGGGIQAAKNPSQVGYGQEVPLYEPAREGFLFLGWNDRADGSGTYYEATPAGRESDLTLYAIWQEIAVSGSAENFNYKMGRESVTVTGYTGGFGENIDLVIPSYIDGKPVVAVEGRFDRYSESHPEQFSLHSLVIPDTVQRLGEECFNHMTIEEPVVIPASVTEIGRNCFAYTEFSLCFAENSSLTSIGSYAFAGARIMNTPVLPEGLERLESYAFSGAILFGGSILLPESLQFIGGYALGVENPASRQRPRMYLPSSVRVIEPRAFGEIGTVYLHTTLTQEDLLRFSEGWGINVVVVFLDEEISGITLRCGGQETWLEGHAFALPTPERDGYTFLGWYDAEEDFISGNYYIPLREGVVLEAVFEEKSDADGRTPYTPARLECGKEYEFVLFSNAAFYFVPDVREGEYFRIEYTYKIACGDDAAGSLFAQDGEGNCYFSGVSYPYGGELLFFDLYGMSSDAGRCPYRMKICIQAA